MIYGICGKKRTGKDTAAKFLTEKYDDVVSIALADEIKRILLRAMVFSGNTALEKLSETNPFYTGDREAPLLMSNYDADKMFTYGISVLEKQGFSLSAKEQIWNAITENQTPWTIRRLMQTFGTDIVCASDPVVWTEIVMRKILRSPKTHFIITDVRQQHEYKYLSKFGAKFVFIQRDTGEDDSHSTEKGLTPDYKDYIILNNGTIPEFEQVVQAIFQFN